MATWSPSPSLLRQGRSSARSACSRPGRGSKPTFPRSLFAPAATETAKARRTFSTWVIPAARLSRSTIVVGSRSNGLTSASGVPWASCLFPCPAAAARSTCCQLVYGGAVSGRALFTNDDRSFIYAQRPVLLSGIGDFVRWADLKDRCVFLRLPPIPRTRCRGEDEFWKAFHADRPAILGAVLDAIVGGLREVPSVHLAELPRMADYAIWGEAVGRGLGWEPGTFLSTYMDNRKEATITDLLDSPLGNVLLQVAQMFTGVSFTPAKLHAALTEIAGKKVAALADWPKTAEKFGNELRRLAPQLRMHGMNVSFESRNEGRVITLKSERPPIVPPRYDGTKIQKS